MNVLIRGALKEDAAAITVLTHQLGYPITGTATLHNLEIILRNSNEAVFVAVDEDKVIGWIGIFKSVYLVSGPVCAIAGLVVDAGYHRKGIGKQLVEQARKWSKEQGDDLLQVRCNVKRKEAHLFYSQLGFKEIKEQKIFETGL